MMILKRSIILALLQTIPVISSVSFANAGTQYTPDQANWDTFNSKPLVEGTSHAPDGAAWLSPESWEAARWDGTIYNPNEMSQEEFYQAICPSIDQIRGIRELFYEVQPFADNLNPTKAEVDEWHRIGINHVRALIGYGEDRYVQKDHCMFARSLWSDERKFTAIWDSAYPNNNCSTVTNNSHCGATFMPNAADQASYLPSGHASCPSTAVPEGVFPSSKSDSPWSIRWVRSFCAMIQEEGFWGGHVGPWYHRENFGFSFWDGNPAYTQSTAILRARWSGELKTEPTEPNTVGSNVKAGDFSAESHPGQKPIEVLENFRKVGWIDSTPNKWIRFDQFDFGSGANTVYVTTSAKNQPNGQVHIRRDSPTGDIVGSITPERSYHWNRFKIQRAELSEVITGVRDLYLTLDGSGYDLKSFRFENEDLNTGNLGEDISAIDFTQESHPGQDPVRVMSNKIGYIKDSPDSWIKFDNFDFGSGANRFYALTSSKKTPTGPIVIQLGLPGDEPGNPTGPIIGSVTPQTTGNWNNFVEQPAVILSEVVSGDTHDLYLKFEGGNFDIRSFRFEYE